MDAGEIQPAPHNARALKNEEQELEIAAKPSKECISAPEPPIQRAEMELDEGVKPRSKFRIFSIMAALMVRPLF